MFVDPDCGDNMSLPLQLFPGITKGGLPSGLRIAHPVLLRASADCGVPLDVRGDPLPADMVQPGLWICPRVLPQASEIFIVHRGLTEWTKGKSKTRFRVEHGDHVLCGHWRSRHEPPRRSAS